MASIKMKTRVQVIFNLSQPYKNRPKLYKGLIYNSITLLSLCKALGRNKEKYTPNVSIYPKVLS